MTMLPAASWPAIQTPTCPEQLDASGRVTRSGGVQTVQPDQSRAVFSGRVGNAAGGAFVPGTYTVEFYLNGRPRTQKKFRVVSEHRIALWRQ